jgi:hypothetical protein
VEKSESESEGGQKFLPPTPFLFAALAWDFTSNEADNYFSGVVRKKIKTYFREGPE